MKTINPQVRKITLAVLMLTILNVSLAQITTENIKPRIAGFGMKFSMLGVEDLGLPQDNLSGGKIFFLSINPTRHFRFEPEFAYSTGTRNSIVGLGDLKTIGVHTGGSAFWMFQKGNTNFYFGPSVSVVHYTYDTEKYNVSSPSQPPYFTKVSMHDKMLSTGLILGGEYFLNRHISLGAELGFFARRYTSEVSNDDERKYKSTTGNLSMRFYL